MPRVADIEGRREQILKAAVAVFGDRGYANATISDIANEAGVAHGTVYLYFHNKAEIFQSLVSRFTNRLIEDISGPTPSDGDDDSVEVDLTRMFHGALDLCHQNPRVTAVCMHEYLAASPDAAKSLRDLERLLVRRLSVRIGRAIERGEVRSVSADFAADLIARLVGVAIERLLALEPDVDVGRLTRDVVDFIMFGLASERSRNNPLTSVVLPANGGLPGAAGSETSPHRCGDREDVR